MVVTICMKRSLLSNGVRSVEASSAWRAEVPKWPVVLWRIRQDSGPDQLCDENH